MHSDSPNVFVSHAHEDARLAKALVTALVGIGVRRQRIRQTSAPDLAIPLGEKWQQQLISDISSSDLVLPLMTPGFDASGYCQTEIGVALGSRKTIMPIRVNASGSGSVFLRELQGADCSQTGLTVLLEEVAAHLGLEPAGAGSATALAQDFLGEIEALASEELLGIDISATERQPEALPSTVVLKRGEITPGLKIIDSTFYLHRAIRDPKARIEECITTGRLIPELFQYVTPVGASRWLELCDDGAYDTYTDSVRFLREKMPSLVEAVGDEVISAVPDYISLGPGNGVKDLLFLRGMLDRERQLGKRQGNWFYYPYDASMYLLRRSIMAVARSGDVGRRIRIKAVCAEFSNLADFRPVFDYRPEPNVFALLGNTLGNMINELEVLDDIRATMNPDDVLILEVRLRDRMDRKNPGGSERVRKRFNFAPLEFLGIPFDAKKLTYDPKEPGLSQIPGTVTLEGTYGPTNYGSRAVSRARLCCINHYELGRLEETLREHSFKVDWSSRSEDQKTGILVLRKANRR